MVQTGASAATYEVYVLPTGATDVSTTAADNSIVGRANAENVNIAPLTVETTAILTSAASYATPALLLRERLNAGDSVRCWVHYGVVTPGNSDLFFILSGVELP